MSMHKVYLLSNVCCIPCSACCAFGFDEIKLLEAVLKACKLTRYVFMQGIGGRGRKFFLFHETMLLGDKLAVTKSVKSWDKSVQFPHHLVVHDASLYIQKWNHRNVLQKV